jgi:hypothetical protein
MTNTMAPIDHELSVAFQLEFKFREIYAAAKQPYGAPTVQGRIADALIGGTPLTYSQETCFCKDEFFDSNRDTQASIVARHRMEPEANALLHSYLRLFRFLDPVRDHVLEQADNPSRRPDQRVYLAHLANGFLIQEPFDVWVTPHR